MSKKEYIQMAATMIYAGASAGTMSPEVAILRATAMWCELQKQGYARQTDDPK